MQRLAQVDADGADGIGDSKGGCYSVVMARRRLGRDGDAEGDQAADAVGEQQTPADGAGLQHSSSI